jgi:hypothetical protein
MRVSTRPASEPSACCSSRTAAPKQRGSGRFSGRPRPSGSRSRMRRTSTMRSRRSATSPTTCSCSISPPGAEAISSPSCVPGWRPSTRRSWSWRARAARRTPSGCFAPALRSTSRRRSAARCGGPHDLAGGRASPDPAGARGGPQARPLPGHPRRVDGLREPRGLPGAAPVAHRAHRARRSRIRRALPGSGSLQAHQRFPGTRQRGSFCSSSSPSAWG